MSSFNNYNYILIILGAIKAKFEIKAKLKYVINKKAKVKAKLEYIIIKAFKDLKNNNNFFLFKKNQLK